MAQLTRLPTEILHEILCHLGPSDHGRLLKLANVTRHFQDYRLDQDSLARICRTCKALQCLARPILYRFPLVYQDGLVSLARTLVTREDLRTRVQGLAVQLGRYDRPKSAEAVSSDDCELFTNLMEKYPERANGEPFLLPPDWHMREEYEEEPASEAEDLICALILTQIPNAERISIDMGWDADFPFCQPGSLPHLVEFSARHESKSCIDMGILDGVLEAAPSLKILNTVSMLDPSTSLHHESITDLDLSECALGAESFKGILRGFPNLQRLEFQPSRYAMGSDDIATAYEVLQSLPIRADTLRHIDLLLEPVNWEPGLFEDPIPCLKGMTVLETLYVDFGNLYPDDAETGLVEFLPPSIRTYEQNYSSEQMVPVMIALAESAPREFPNLRQVSFGRLYRDEINSNRESSAPMVTQIFREKGIECFFDPEF